MSGPPQELGGPGKRPVVSIATPSERGCGAYLLWWEHQLLVSPHGYKTIISMLISILMPVSIFPGSENLIFNGQLLQEWRLNACG